MAKAQGLSITTIIIAAIALVVLIVLVVILTSKTNLFSKGVSNVQNKFDVNACEIEGTGTQRVCEQSPCEEGGTRIEGKTCPSGEICCSY